MPKSKNKRKKNGSKSGKNRTPLLSHKKVGKELQSGFAQISDKITFSSWSNERLPEMLWAAIIRVIADQDYAISEFRRVISFVADHEQKEQLSELTISAISNLDEPLREDFIQHLLANPATASALTILTLFEKLPARDSWLKFLPDVEPDIDILMMAVGMCLPHQSQEATDCRWLKVMLQVVSGKFHAPREMVEQWVNYPYEGDMRSIRPSIRASEMNQNPFIKHDLSWANDFWDSAWHNTPCLTLPTVKEDDNESVDFTSEDIAKLRSKLEEHWNQTHSTTAIDAKHDGVFGIAFYVLTILDEMMGSGVNTGILGRLALRTILESHINLRYLLTKNDDDLWRKWRTYGAGQAKLNALRFDELMDAPKFINTQTIEGIAGEDLWEEFINIDLGSWSGSDLRKMSEKAGVKPAYDKFYSWTSGYSHVTWGAIRETSFKTCGNPLHRLHRYPKKSQLPDTLHDAVSLVNEVLSDLSIAYPDFIDRVGV